MTGTAPRVHRRWALIGILGELIFTLGALMLLFVIYQLWWTNLAADRASEHLADELVDSWSIPAEETVPQIQTSPGEAFARMYIPRLRESVWGIPVIAGVSALDLSRGLGHYPGSALPGEVGNFAVAGHRATNGEPLRAIDQLRAGDKVYVETSQTWSTYVLERDLIVQPTEVWVIDPVPGQPGREPTEALLTLTTCHPRWGSTQRWIWWGTLKDSFAKSKAPLPDELRIGP